MVEVDRCSAKSREVKLDVGRVEVKSARVGWGRYQVRDSRAFQRATGGSAMGQEARRRRQGLRDLSRKPSQRAALETQQTLQTETEFCCAGNCNEIENCWVLEGVLM